MKVNAVEELSQEKTPCKRRGGFKGVGDIVRGMLFESGMEYIEKRRIQEAQRDVEDKNRQGQSTNTTNVWKCHNKTTYFAR